MDILCLDLEGVLVPEIWQAVAKSTGIEELSKTTRDIPDYDELMTFRMRIVDQHGIKLSQIQRDISSLRPLEGALEFLNWIEVMLPHYQHSNHPFPHNSLEVLLLFLRPHQ